MIYNSLKGRDRLQYELDKLMNQKDINNCFGVDYFDPDVDNPDITHWQITLIPPEGTNYEGGLFKIEAKFREDYPETAPIMKFLTRIFHCNICYNTGHFCLNTLKQDWSKKLTMEDVLNHIIVTLFKQNPCSPLNNVAARLYKEKMNIFIDEVKKNIKEYANEEVFQDLSKQNIRLIKDCNCYWCNQVCKSID